MLYFLHSSSFQRQLQRTAAKRVGFFCLFVSLAQMVDSCGNLKKVHLGFRYIQLSPTVISRNELKPVIQAQLWTQVESEHKSDCVQQSQHQFSPILRSHWHPQHRQLMGFKQNQEGWSQPWIFQVPVHIALSKLIVLHNCHHMLLRATWLKDSFISFPLFAHTASLYIHQEFLTTVEKSGPKCP